MGLGGDPEFQRLQSAVDGLLSSTNRQFQMIDERLSKLENVTQKGGLMSDDSKWLMDQFTGLHGAIRSEVSAIKTERRWFIGLLVPVLLAAVGFVWNLGTNVTRLDTTVTVLSANVEKLSGNVEKLDSLQTTVGSLQTTVASFGNTVSELSGSVRDLRGSVDTLAQRVSYLEGASSQKKR